jgi:2-amino-4-hydroxy-6-hydroxymethyldihydropteridine diphosphokinase
MEMSAGPPFWGTRAYIGLGSNLGNSAASLRSAVLRLADLGTVAAASPVYETDPVGYEDQPVFLNAVVALDTTLPPETLLAELHAIEAELKRERSTRWGPRTLDLDLLWYGGREIETPALIVPHPRAREREFVLRPLADIAPDAEIGGVPAAQLLAELPAQGVRPTGHSLM